MRTIVLVLRSGGDFSFSDVELITKHILGKWKHGKPRILVLYDKASTQYDLGDITIIPLRSKAPGTWSRIELYTPEMEQYKPFLYIDLDTAVINSIENIFDLVKDYESEFVTLEDFWQPGKLATGLVWFPANNKKTKIVWEAFKGLTQFGSRMDAFLWQHLTPDVFWQEILNSNIIDFKPKSRQYLTHVPKNTNLVCFHGKPRIPQASAINWVADYIAYEPIMRKVTVIIPYKIDRGWLKEAICSVPMDVQLIACKGEKNWPSQFNKAFHDATGDYIKYLHEDDMLTPNCIHDSVVAMDVQKVDFLHGNAIELHEATGKKVFWKPEKLFPNLQEMLQKNYLHSASLMYRRSVFEKVGLFDESLNTAEEYEFNLRCLQNGMKLGYCDSFLAYYRRHNGQKVRVVPVSEKNAEREMVRNKYKK